MRPLYLTVNFWGDRFRSYFTDYCLPSLLSPHNLTLLRAEDGHKFLIATTENDWKEFERHPIFRELARHIKPVLLEIGLPADESDAAKFRHMNSMDLLLMGALHRERALACQIKPDTMFTDGTVSTILRHAKAGAHAVLAVAFRMAEEKLFADLRRNGLLPEPSSVSPLPRIVLPPRQVVNIAVRSIYHDLLQYDWDAGDLPLFSPFCFWRIPGKDEILIHSTSFAYLLIDFAAIETNNTESFAKGWSIENIWLSDNFPDPSKIRVLQDSDEAILLSWAPSPDPMPAHSRRAVLNIPLLSPLWKGWRLRSSWGLNAISGDVQKMNSFRYPIHWHAGATLGGQWQITEARVRRIMFWFFGDVYEEFNVLSPRNPSRWVMSAWWAMLRFVVTGGVALHITGPCSRRVHDVIHVIRIVGRRVGLTLCGDKTALRWWGWRLRKLGSNLIRRPFDEPRPPLP